MYLDQQQIRQTFFNTYKKLQKDEKLSLLEQQLASVIKQHPEYHPILEDPIKNLEKTFNSENNPFLHMGLHLGLIEQLSTDRPSGIREIYQQLCQRRGNAHQIEHLLMQAMAETIWEAQQNGQLPDEDTYLKRCQKLLYNEQ